MLTTSSARLRVAARACRARRAPARARPREPTTGSGRRCRPGWRGRGIRTGRPDAGPVGELMAPHANCLLGLRCSGRGRSVCVICPDIYPSAVLAVHGAASVLGLRHGTCSSVGSSRGSRSRPWRARRRCSSAPSSGSPGGGTGPRVRQPLGQLGAAAAPSSGSPMLEQPAGEGDSQPRAPRRRRADRGGRVGDVPGGRGQDPAGDRVAGPRSAATSGANDASTAGRSVRG